MSRLFVTGTDTEVGKTVVTGLLGAQRPVAKPLLSGSAHEPTDLQTLMQLTGRAPAHFMSWRTPVSPHRAACIEDAPLDVDALRAWMHRLPEDAVVEGVGGWRVPLAPGFTVTDLARCTGERVLLVAADRLGVLNHTQLSIEAIDNDGFTPVAVVLNATESPDASAASNLEDLRSLLSVPVLAVPFMDLSHRPSIEAARRGLITGLQRHGVDW